MREEVYSTEEKLKDQKPKANKKLGQHYLNNQKTIENICNDFEGMYDIILEIGPGPATLTKELVKKNKSVYLIEKDDRFIQILEKLETVPKFSTLMH